MSTQSRDQSRTEKAAAVRAEQARRERNRRVGITAGIIVVVAAIIAGGFWFTRDTTPVAAPGNLTVKADGSAMVVGNDASAPVKVVVYEDFLCPFCQQFERQTRSLLHRDAAAGSVLVEYRPFKLLQPDYSTLALNAWGQVLTKGTPKQALAFHDALYDNQPYEQDADSYGVDFLKKTAKEAGIPSSISDDFGTQNETFLNAAQKSAQDAKVTSTPTVLVNGEPLTGGSIDELVANLEKKISAG